MKVSLINCPQSSYPYLYLGLPYIASSVSIKHRVQFIDLAFCTKNYKKVILSEIKNDIPDVVAFSVNSANIHHVVEIVRFLKQRLPSVLVMLGGVYPTLLPEAMLRYSGVDAICVGEGERSFSEYLDKLDRNKEPLIQGIWYKKNNQDIIKNELRPFESDLDSLPFPKRDIFDVSKYIKISSFSSLPFIASRGCVYDCSFCSSPAIRKNFPGKYFRLRSPHNLIEEIEREVTKFWNQGFRCIEFEDDNFGVDLNWFYEFCLLYKKSRLHKKISWFCHTRADKITDQWAKLASESGCIMVGIGVESGDENIRKQVYNKKITNRSIERALDFLKQYNIGSFIYMMLGFYEENEYTIKKSVQYARKLSPSIVYFFNFKPFPGISLAKDIQDRTGVKDGIELMDYWNSKKNKLLYLDNKLLYKIIIRIQRKYVLKELYKTIIWGRIEFISDFVKFIMFLKGFLMFSFNLNYRLIKSFLHSSYCKYALKQIRDNSKSK